MVIDNLKTREEVTNFLEGYVYARKEELDAKTIESRGTSSYEIQRTAPEIREQSTLNKVSTVNKLWL